MHSKQHANPSGEAALAADLITPTSEFATMYLKIWLLASQGHLMITLVNLAASTDSQGSLLLQSTCLDLEIVHHFRRHFRSLCKKPSFGFPVQIGEEKL